MVNILFTTEQIFSILNGNRLVKHIFTMKKSKVRAMVSPMLLAKKVREFAKLNAWKMHQMMGKNSVQAYLSLERSAQRISLKDLIALRNIYTEHGGTVEAFDKLVERCAGSKK